MNKPNRVTVSFAVLLCWGLLPTFLLGQNGAEGPFAAVSDSVWKLYSIEDLVEYQRYYDKTTENLIVEADGLRRNGIEDMESFVAGHPDSPVLDKILIRLAYMYYQSAVAEFEAKSEAYSQALESYENNELDSIPAEPFKNYDRAFATYKRVIAEYADSPLVDDAIYSIGFLLEDIGQSEAAFETFKSLIRDYPESRYAPIAYMRMAEFFFNPARNELEKAIALYKRVLDYKENPKYDAALYRLGWAHYKLHDYVSAISYFTILADDIDYAKELDPENKYHFPAVRDEAIEYIGISFLDLGGPSAAARYLDEIGGRDYGFDVLKKIGDSYMDVKEEYELAVKTYELMLAMYPFAPDAPKIQARIAEAHRQMDDERMAYVTRTKLFENYNSDGRWWRQVVDAKAKREAVELAERALRENINLLLRRGAETGDTDLFFQAVNDSRNYLQSFPKDSNAVLIHWNMALALDTKLAMRGEAYDEYLHISNLYWDTRFQKQAAENAIAIADEVLEADSLSVVFADTLPDASKLGEPVSQDSLAKVLNLEPESLTDAERKVCNALDNYIRLFPHETETARMLAKTGAIYYERHRFKQSLKYFKTLIRHFPESSEANYARYLTMESYFGNADYESTEIMARKLRDAGVEYTTYANNRLAEAIFLQAQVLADSAKHIPAAREYRRVVAEVPSVDFADLALYNAALEYDLAGEFAEAIDTYKDMIDGYPQSENYLYALNNLAFDYRELGDNLNAGMTYETLADLRTEEAEAQEALFNASVSYVQSQAWTRAIEVNDKFVSRFADAKDADELLFNNAGYYLKLDDAGKAHNTYKQFIQKYPNSPLLVEAYYHRGNYLLEQGQHEAAKDEFKLAVRGNTDLKNAALPANDFFAAEALFQLAELKFDEFARISFLLPAEALAESKREKKKMLLELADDYTKVAAFGTFRLFEATYRIGTCYEQFAETWATQEVPDGDFNQVLLRKKEINNASAELYRRTAESYESGLRALRKFSDAYRQTSLADSLPTGPDSVAAVDSTLQIGERWIRRCRGKVSESIYRIAEYKAKSIPELLSAEPPAGIHELERLIYRKQLVAKAIKPLVDEAEAAYRNHLNEARRLGVHDEWTSLSRHRLLEVSNVIPREFQRLGSEALDGYRKRAAAYSRLVAAKSDSVELSEQMANFIELSHAFTMASAKDFRRNLSGLKDTRADTNKIQAETNDLLKFLYSMHSEVHSALLSVEVQRYEQERLFKKTGDSFHEDAFLTLDDSYFTLERFERGLLEFGFEISRDLKLKNEWSERIMIALVRLSPDEFAPVLGYEVMANTVVSDSTWLASAEAKTGWVELGFRDADWSKATVEVRSKYADALSIWSAPQILPVTPDTSKAPADSADLVIEHMFRPNRVFFRKHVLLDGLPVMVRVRLVADDYYRLFVNGKYVVDHQFPTEVGGFSEAMVHNLTEYVKPGENVIAIEVADSDGTGGSFGAVMDWQSIPGWKFVSRDGTNTQDNASSGENRPAENKE